jgi:hypothetical protein
VEERVWCDVNEINRDSLQWESCLAGGRLTRLATIRSWWCVRKYVKNVDDVEDKKICKVPFLEDLQKDNIYQILKNVDMDVIKFLMSLLQN